MNRRRPILWRLFTLEQRNESMQYGNPFVGTQAFVTQRFLGWRRTLLQLTGKRPRCESTPSRAARVAVCAPRMIPDLAAARAAPIAIRIGDLRGGDDRR